MGILVEDELTQLHHGHQMTMPVAGNRSIVLCVPASCETEEEAKGQWRFLSVMDDQEVVIVTALSRSIGRRESKGLWLLGSND